MPEITPNYPSVTEVIDDYLVQQPERLRKRLGGSLRAVAAQALKEWEDFPEDFRGRMTNLAVSTEIYELDDTKMNVARIETTRARQLIGD